MKFHKCNCLFIPPHVLDKLARSNKGNARVTIKQSNLTRIKRRAKQISIAQFTQGAGAGEGLRKIYDSQNQWKKQVKLVLADGQNLKTDDDAAKTAFDYAGKVRDFFKGLGRNSYDNQGSDIILNIHFGIEYNNAFWDSDTDELTFGDGDGTIFRNLISSLDVVAHEFGHGVVQYTANLEYYSQSGALNESFADVFGSAITQHVLGQDAESADWLIGDEIMGEELYGEALRSMKAPGTAYDNSIIGKDPQPDHMKRYYTGSEDNQGVHINSGIPNRVFYIVSKAIGTEKATLIWYHALQKLWPSAVFNDAVEVISESARILTRDKKVPLGSTQTVRAAFKRVGLPT